MPVVAFDHLDIVAFADPAGSKTKIKRVGARSAIAVVGGDIHEHVFLLHAWAKRTTTDKFIDAIFEINERWHPRQFGIEANAMQSIFADAVRREARFNALRIPLHDVNQPTGIEKPFRIRSALQPVINEGRFFMLDDQIEAWNELETHPMCATFDIADAIASAVGLLRKRPKALAASDDEAALLRHLRATGAKPEVILAYQRKIRGDLPATPPRAA